MSFVTPNAIAVVLMLLAVGGAALLGRKLNQKYQWNLINTTVEKLNRHGSAREIHRFCSGHGLEKSTLVQDLRCVPKSEMANLLVSLVYISWLFGRNGEECAADIATQLLQDKVRDSTRYTIIRRMISRNDRHPEAAKILLQQLELHEAESVSPPHPPTKPSSIDEMLNRLDESDREYFRITESLTRGEFLHEKTPS